DVGDYGDPSGGPEVLPGRAVFTAGCDGWARADDAQSGAAVWKQQLYAPVVARPRLTADRVRLGVGTASEVIVNIHCRRDEGRRKIPHSVNAEGAIDRRPATRGNFIYAASRDGRLRTIDAKTYEVLSIYDCQDAVCCGPIVAGDHLYIGTRSGRVHVLAADDT